jgi:hypothetical protein
MKGKGKKPSRFSSKRMINNILEQFASSDEEDDNDNEESDSDFC